MFDSENKFTILFSLQFWSIFLHGARQILVKICIQPKFRNLCNKYTFRALRNCMQPTICISLLTNTSRNHCVPLSRTFFQGPCRYLGVSMIYPALRIQCVVLGEFISKNIAPIMLNVSFLFSNYEVKCYISSIRL
jgi:hypothetical protein